MGSGIAALAASAGIPVVLLDVAAPDGDRSAPARKGLERARKARPAAFMDADRARAVRTGNIDDDLALLADCDLIVEAIIEQVEPKRKLYASLEPLLSERTIVASNTSGIPIETLAQGRGEGFRERFLGMHFFNPPRYLHLLEIIPTPDTAPASLASAAEFSDRLLGKGIVVARDVPGFVANRLGVFGMVLAIRLMEQHDLGIDDVDVLTGPLTARAKSATFRTADLSGIDVIAHVTRGLSDTTGEDFSLSAWVLELVDAGRVGEKSGGGFYTKTGKEIRTLDWRTGEYAPQQRATSPEVQRLLKLPLPERFAALRDWTGAEGDFVREYLLRFSHYVLATAAGIAYDIPSVDHAMEWGYAWEIGPFKQMDLLGADWLRHGFERLGLDEPPLLRGVDRFYSADGLTVKPLSRDSAGREGVAGARAPLESQAPPLSLRTLAHAGSDARLARNDDATVWNVDGVAVLELHSKLNALTERAIGSVHTALDLVESRGLAGLVLGNEDPRAFSAGADLGLILSLARAGDWDATERAVRGFQETALRLRRSPFPVVSAAFGLTLGGGCEFSLYADRVQAHAELYMGLVEIGVGVIPAGGGTTELLFRFTEALAPYPEADPFEALKRAFQLIGMAATSTSALDARRLGLLRSTDRVTMNRDRLLDDAVRAVREMAPEYVAPLPRHITAMGRQGLGNLHYAAWALHEAGQASEHDVRIAHELAYVLCGGDGPPREVTEDDVLALEREAFLTLLGTPQTQQRIQAMLETGKPLRN
jgi:3-hydroxyacyl-CoA dehydrogenase